MKKLFLSTLLLALPLLASAYDAEVDGIYYNLISKGNMAEVTYKETDQWNNPISHYSGNVSIPQSITFEGIEYRVVSIGENAFFNSYNLISVNIPNSVTIIENNSFRNCFKLSSVNIPASVTNIGLMAFYYCSNLISISIPNSVTSIGEAAFQGCSGLTSVTIPSSLTSIGRFVFSGCSNLTNITIPNSVTKIEYAAFSGCSNLSTVNIPNTLTTIEWFAFSNCSHLISISIPNSVTIIGRSAFEGCINLVSITLPKTLTTIEMNAFANCVKLVEVYCHAVNIPNTNTDAFEKTHPEYMTLYIPAESLSTYKTTVPWSQFGTILPLTYGDQTGVEQVNDSQTKIEDYYTTNGTHSEHPIKGINVIRMSNGTTKKVIVK